MIRRSRLLAFPALSLVLFTAAGARAQATGFNVNRLEPSERGSAWFANESLDLRGSLRPAFGLVSDYQVRPLVAYRQDGEIASSIVRNMWVAHLGGGVTFVDRVRFSLNLPLQLFADGHDGFIGTTLYKAPPSEQGIGDLRGALDVRLFGEHGDIVRGAIGAQLWLPTGQKDQYMGDGDVRVAPRAMLAGTAGELEYSARLGVTYRGRSETLSGGSIGSAFDFGASAGLWLGEKKVLVGPEIFGSTVFDDAFAKRTTPLEGVLGGHWFASDTVRVGAGFGRGLTRGFGSPAARVLLSLEWVASVEKPAPPPPPPERKDRDHDGIYDEDDACPDTPGRADPDPKKNGCPEPPDRDKDGILDTEDACPDVPGVRTSDPKTNGCPPDTDGDGVLDADDACPTVPGLKTDDPKTNGCPDPDRDKDGVPNDQDACPDEPGKPDPDPKKNGCPIAFVQAGQIKILDQVKFKTASAEIVKGKESEEVLEAVLKVLQSHSEIKVVRVEGHTDNRGAAAMNKKLSADRAASVVKWLTDHGIDKQRMKSAGFGPDRPIETNSTDEGRRQNRRVEFHIEE